MKMCSFAGLKQFLLFGAADLVSIFHRYQVLEIYLPLIVKGSTGCFKSRFPFLNVNCEAPCRPINLKLRMMIKKWCRIYMALEF